MFSIVRTKSGKVRWVGISSTAHRDEDREIVSRAALKQAVARAKERGNFGPLRFWHEPGLDLGTTDFMELTEDGKYLIESGLIENEALASAMQKSLEKSAWQMSIGFRHPRSEPDEEKIFHNIDIFERSIVPYGKAANRLTSFTVKDTATTEKHLPGKHRQSDHGRTRGGGGGGGGKVYSNRVLNNIIDSVRAQGGMSVKVDSGSVPTTGYMVARDPKDGLSQVVSADEFYTDKGRQILADYMTQNQQAFQDETYLGLWHNTADGQVYLDVSDNIQDRDTAVRLGRERNQISIWDVTGFAEIDTGGTGKSRKDEYDTRQFNTTSWW